MYKFLLVEMLLGSTAAFTQILGLSDFKAEDSVTFSRSFKTEQEAVDAYKRIVDINGFDSSKISFQYGNNPVAFDGFIKRNMAHVGTIVTYDNGYAILFFILPNKTIHIMTVYDNDGNEVRLIYKKKKQ